MLDWKPRKAGDWFHIPPGTIHAIGAGVQLVEIQQNADITYRLYDYGRPRELHLEDGIAVSEPGPYDGACGQAADTQGAATLFDGRYFRIARHAGQNIADLDWSGESYCIPVRGSFVLSGETIGPGDVALGDVAMLKAVQDDGEILIAQSR